MKRRTGGVCASEQNFNRAENRSLFQGITLDMTYEYFTTKINILNNLRKYELKIKAC